MDGRLREQAPTPADLQVSTQRVTHELCGEECVSKGSALRCRSASCAECRNDDRLGRIDGARTTLQDELREAAGPARDELRLEIRPGGSNSCCAMPSARVGRRRRSPPSAAVSGKRGEHLGVKGCGCIKGGSCDDSLGGSSSRPALACLRL